MSDYSIMRSGLIGEQRGVESGQLEFMRNVMSLMRLLMEEAVKSAAVFAATCGRKRIVAEDSVMALKYEAHTFFKKDIEARFAEVLAEEREHTYETSDEESGEESDESSEETYTTELTDKRLSATHRAFHARVLKYHNEWGAWEPTDAFQVIIKKAVDRAEAENNASRGSG